jgi:hypothetical protein
VASQLRAFMNPVNLLRLVGPRRTWRLMRERDAA